MAIKKIVGDSYRVVQTVEASVAVIVVVVVLFNSTRTCEKRYSSTMQTVDRPAKML